MRGQDKDMQDNGAAFRPGTATQPEADPADDLGLAEEAHALISLFLDIEDGQARRRCIDYVRHEARGAGVLPEA